MSHHVLLNVFGRFQSLFRSKPCCCCKSLLIGIGLVVFSHASLALSADEYQQLLQESRPVMKLHINGVVLGFDWSNRMLKASDSQELYCMPDTSELSVDDYMTLLDQQLEQSAAVTENQASNDSDTDTDTNVPVELSLLVALVKKYPCVSQSGEQ
ncbi:hypothetical protein [Oceanobacter mangrovi]|uniref:hypothetical protein n=1 Tax=Oceanobacter mangrovi TaxID=2862510 RepID=UPI001C8E33C9|nr:hypothetical protein [Oceanobacter mangrovi]